MRHANLFLAAATILLGSVAPFRAEPLPASNSTENSTHDLGAAPITVPADSTAAPAVVTPSHVAEIAAQPQEVKSGPIPHAMHAVVPPHRPVTHRARLGYFCSNPSARVAKRAMPPRVVVPQAAVSLAASSERQYVLLGVGF
jgi:hypothetical protein